MRLRQREEARNVGGVVLAIGIDLQHMGVPMAARVAEPRQHGASLALVHRQPEQAHLRRMQRGQTVELEGARRARAVIHQKAGVAGV